MSLTPSAKAKAREHSTGGMASKILRALVLLSTIIQTASANPTSKSSSACDSKALSDAADAYIASQTSGTLESLNPFLSSNWTYIENNKPTSLTTSILTKPLKIDHRRTNTDTVSCATYTEVIITDSASPYVIGTQIHHNASDGKVKLVDSIVSTTNSWLFDAKKTLQHVLEEKWDVIPEGKRDSRVVIQAAGDAYLDMWSNATSSDAVPWGTPCTRLEGSQYTGKNKPDDSCKPGIPSNHNQKPNVDRRYVIDESMGSVSIFCVWEHMMNASDSHEFRLENGKLRYVHTMTVCGGQACKL